ncbi:hypothetical protein L195_g033007, partial [Trifolium pratense]
EREFEDKNGDGFSLLREIEATHLKEERFEGKKLNLVELKRVVGGRKVLREEEDRSLSMASVGKGMKMKGKRRTGVVLDRV